MTKHLCIANAVLGVSLAAAGCSPIVRELNKRWPPVSPVDHQQRAVAEAIASLEKVTNPLALVSIDASALALIADEMKKRVQATYATGPHKAAIEALEVRSARQEVVVSAKAGITFDDDRSDIAGVFEIHTSASVDRGNLVLRPAFANLSLTRVKYRGTSGRGIVLDLVNAAVKTFLKNLNGAIEAQRFSLKFGQVVTLDPGDTKVTIPPGLPITAKVEGTPVNVGIALGQTAVLVDDRGIVAVADAFAPTNAWLAAAAQSLRARMSQPVSAYIPTSEDLALLAFCGGPVPAVADMAVLCSWAGPRLADQPATGPASTTFESYQAAFSAKKARLSDGTAGATVAASISRRELATATNAFLDGAYASGTATLASYALPDFKSTLRLPPTTQLNCTAPDRFPGCNSDFDKWHDEHFGAYSERGCPGSCGTFDFGCHGWKLDCERLKATEKGAYEAAKLARKAQFGIEKAACELRKEGQIKGCQLNQAWLDHWGDKDVGEVKASSNISNAALNLSLARVSLAPDFGSVSLATRLTGGVDVSVGITLTPHNEGHIVCWGEWKGDTSTHVDVETLTPNVLGSLVGVGNRGFFRTTPVELKVSLDPPPLRKLLLDDKGELFMKCPLPTALLGGPAAVAPMVLLIDQLLEKPSFNFTVPAAEVPFVIPAMNKRLGERSVSLAGEITPTTLAFRANVAGIPAMDRVTMPAATEWPLHFGGWFASTAGAFGSANAAFRKDISVPMPLVSFQFLDPRLRAFASLAPGPAFRGPGPTLGLAFRPVVEIPALLAIGVRVPTGSSGRGQNPVRLLVGIAIEK